MIISVTGRQTGKTTKILQMLKENDKAVMAVHCEDEKKRLLFENPELKGRIKTYNEMKTKNMCSNEFEECYLDNLDILLSRLRFELPITYVSITGDLE